MQPLTMTEDSTEEWYIPTEASNSILALLELTRISSSSNAISLTFDKYMMTHENIQQHLNNWPKMLHSFLGS